jgi:opacity protein-like surface antigen
MRSFSRLLLFLACYLGGSAVALAQDERGLMPPALQDAYFELGVGAVAGDYGAAQFQDVPGYAFESAQLQAAAVRLVAGYEFSRHLSAQISYMRPVSWVRYTYAGSAGRESGSVRLMLGGLTLRPQLPLTDNLSVYGEAGVGVVTRSGIFAPDGTPLVEAASYVGLLLGAGIAYRVNDRWALLASAAYSPENAGASQPATTIATAGFSYTILPTSARQRRRAADSDFVHPEQWVQVGYASNALGYGANNAFEDAGLFWGGEAEVRGGLTLQYQRNVYHGPRFFALDWGVSASYWLSDKDEQGFYSLAVFPVFRFNLIHTRPLDAYVAYSVAGPAYLSRVVIDGVDTGEHFTFQDTVGAGVFFGKDRNLNAEIRIGHYSNGNVFAENGGVKVPLSVNLGYAF